jgi:hypothetical protein
MSKQRNWVEFASQLLAAAAKGMTADEFAEQLGEDADLIRTDYQSFKTKLKARIEKSVGEAFEKLVASGAKPVKTVAEVVAAKYSKEVQPYTLKGGRGAKVKDIGVQFEVDASDFE